MNEGDVPLASQLPEEHGHESFPARDHDEETNQHMDPHSCLQDLQDASLERVALDKLPTNTTTNNHPVHRWFNFIAGFSPELVDASVSLARHRPNPPRRLLDPFSGCGTAPLAARLAGLSAVAYEPHPFLAVISEAKANSHKYWIDLEAIHAAILRGLHAGNRNGVPLSRSAAAFLRKMFREEDLTRLCSARHELDACGFGSHPLAILILSRILDHCCLAATDGIYRAPTSRKRALPARAALERVQSVLTGDAQAAQLDRSSADIYTKSSQRMDELKDRSVDLVVTSPPYINNFDFAEMTRMYLYFWEMATSWSEITARVRNRLILNTTTALSQEHRQRQQEYRDTLPDDIRGDADAVVAALSERRTERAGKKDYHLLIYPYFSQMQQVLRETHRVLRRGAGLHMMVSDAALYGVHVPAPQWLARTMSGCGFRDVQCELVRPRGHRWVLEKRERSVQGLGEYHVFARAS